jgi:hypothetical protein
MKTVMVIVMAMVMATGALYGEAIGQAPPIPSAEQPEVLTRGPVNEAFAHPVNLEDQTGLIAPTEPPAEDISRDGAQNKQDAGVATKELRDRCADDVQVREG